MIAEGAPTWPKVMVSAARLRKPVRMSAAPIAKPRLARCNFPAIRFLLPEDCLAASSAARRRSSRTYLQKAGRPGRVEIESSMAAGMMTLKKATAIRIAEKRSPALRLFTKSRMGFLGRLGGTFEAQPRRLAGEPVVVEAKACLNCGEDLLVDLLRLHGKALELLELTRDRAPIEDRREGADDLVDTVEVERHACHLLQAAFGARSQALTTNCAPSKSSSAAQRPFSQPFGM